MTDLKSREIRLKAYPQGLPTAETFEICEVDVPEPGPGAFRVRNIYMSVDPYMRGRMRQGESYVAAFEVGKALDGGAIGVVEASNNPDFPENTLVMSSYGWREYFISEGEGLRKIAPIEGASLTAHMGGGWRHGADSLCRAPAHRGPQDGRQGVCFGRGRCGGADGLPDRETEGLLCGWLGRVGRKMQMAGRNLRCRRDD